MTPMSPEGWSEGSGRRSRCVGRGHQRWCGRGGEKYARNGCHNHRTGIRRDDDGIEFEEGGWIGDLSTKVELHRSYRI